MEKVAGMRAAIILSVDTFSEGTLILVDDHLESFTRFIFGMKSTCHLSYWYLLTLFLFTLNPNNILFHLLFNSSVLVYRNGLGHSVSHCTVSRCFRKKPNKLRATLYPWQWPWQPHSIEKSQFINFLFDNIFLPLMLWRIIKLTDVL